MLPGLDNLRHILVLMTENRSFDHMLGSLPGIGGIDDAGTFNNPALQVGKGAHMRVTKRLRRLRRIGHHQAVVGVLASAFLR
jgi:phospholipase C